MLLKILPQGSKNEGMVHLSRTDFEKNACLYVCVLGKEIYDSPNSTLIHLHKSTKFSIVARKLLSPEDRI